MKTNRRILFALLFTLVMALVPIFTLAAPLRDGGDFPTLTPTVTATPLPTATNIPQPAVATMVPPYPAITNTPASMDAGTPDNIIGQNQPTPTATPTTSGTNPLVTIGTIVFVIFLFVILWIIFSRRGLNPNP